MPKKVDIPASIKKIVDSYYEVDFTQIYNFATFIEGALIINPRNKDDCGKYSFVIKVFNRDDAYQIGEKKVNLEVSDKGTNKPKCPYKNPKECQPTISKVTQYGQVFIKFPLPLKQPLPLIKQYPEISKMLKF